MTRSFLKRSAVAAVLLTFGIASVWGDNSLYDKFISSYGTLQIAIVLAALSAFWCALALWVCSALRFPPGGHWRDLPRSKSAAVIAVISAACISAQPARAWVLPPAEFSQPSQTLEIHQPFTLSPDDQRQVDAAIADAGEGANDNPGFVVTIELAIGIFIAAVIIGTTLYIVVRMVCKSLDRMKTSLGNRLGKLKEFLSDPSKTNSPVMLGAALFNHRTATTNDLPIGKELVIGFTATAGATALTASVPVETVSFDEFIADFGLTDKLPLDSSVGSGLYHAANGAYVVSPDGSPNLVKFSIESCTNLVQNAWSSVLSLRVPVGAVLDFSDLTGNSENRYWRVGVAP